MANFASTSPPEGVAGFVVLDAQDTAATRVNVAAPRMKESTPCDDIR